MSVRKFRSIEDMPDDSWKTPGDPVLYRALERIWDLSRRMRPRRFPAGVYKHRSMDELNRQRDQWDAEFVALVAVENAAPKPGDAS